MKKLLFSTMLTQDGWRRDVLLEIDSKGRIGRIEPEVRGGSATRVTGLAIPGVPNAHSHAHQRLLAGLAEAGPQRGDFLRWRELMYRVVGRMDPGGFQAVAEMAYMEMLKSGYTSVAEFHYLHHGPHGTPYSQPQEMGLRCIAAARETGIAMTLLPSLYAYGGFGGQPAQPEQARFVCGPEMYMEIYRLLHSAAADLPDVRLGFAPHSLRAVDEKGMRDVLEEVRVMDSAAPVHIHVAEQRWEVDACLEWCGATPVQRLVDQAPVDAGWNVVHATHMTESERRALAAAHARVVVCPTTEANLGDGLFGAREWVELDGEFAIGSDSQVSICPADEMRLLEYGQRLLGQTRNGLSAKTERSAGGFLLKSVSDGGAGALAQPCGVLTQGARADIVVLDDEHPALIARTGDDALDSWIFSGGAQCVRDVFVGGRRVVSDYRHVREAEIVRRYRVAAEGLLQ